MSAAVSLRLSRAGHLLRAVCLFTLAPVAHAADFEGTIEIVITQSGGTTSLRHTVGAESERIEITGSDAPNPVDLVERKTGAITLLFPANHSFLRLEPAAATGAPKDLLKLKPTGKTEKILGFPCREYEVAGRGEKMEIWATESLLPFQPYQQNEGQHFGPRLLEEQWPEQLRAERLFPLRAILHSENNAENYRFEVKGITPEKIADKDGRLFRPPPDYAEIHSIM